MKASAEFYNKIAVHHDAIKKICKDELTAMKEPFCKHEYVNMKTHSLHPIGTERLDKHFEHRVFTNGFWILQSGAAYMVTAVRHYIYEDEWSVVVRNEEGTVCDEISVDYLSIAEKIELVMLLKRELFDY